MSTPEMRAMRSALPLLVARVLADDHHPTVATDHLALVAHLLHRRLDLHGSLLGSDLAEVVAQLSGEIGGGWCERGRENPAQSRGERLSRAVPPANLPRQDWATA